MKVEYSGGGRRWLNALRRFLVYGILGWLIEVFFTGIKGLLAGDFFATSTTYLWMLPVYGTASLVMEAIDNRFRSQHWLVLAPLFTLVIFGIEYSSGAGLAAILGRCPWDYGSGPWSPGGLINLRYTPFWFALAAVFRPVRERVLWVSLMP